MESTRSTKYFIIALILCIISSPLIAFQTDSDKSDESFTDTNISSDCSSQQDNCLSSSGYHPLFPGLLNESDIDDETINDSADVEFFSLQYLLNFYDKYESELGSSWTVVTSLDETNEGVQNEIDLSEVENLESSEENDNDSLETRPLVKEFRHHQKSDSWLGIFEQGIQLDFTSPFYEELCKSPSESQSSDLAVEYAIPDIPIYTNKKIEAFIRLYTVKKRDMFIKAINRYPEYKEMIADTLIKYELPLNLAFLAVVESNLNPEARSRANAVGLWQFMSYTGKHFGLSRSWWHDDRYDPEKSTDAAARYLKQLLRQFKGDWELALAAYNSGSGTVRRALKRARTRGKAEDYWSLRLPRETRGYVPAFYAVATIFSDLEKYGFDQVKQMELASTEKQLLDVGGGISLNQLAKVFEVSHQELVDLNPRLRFRGLTPPTYETFAVAIPANIEITKNHYQTLEELKANRQEEWKIHKVKQGETLWSISRYYHIPMDTILEYNRLRKKSYLRIGQQLMLPVPVDWDPPTRKSNTQLAVSDIDKVPGVTKIHVVQKGETLWQISQKYNISIAKIRHWNRRVLGRYLRIGTEIVLKLPTSVASNSI